MFAHVVPSKGVDESGFSINVLVEDVKWLGYSRVTLTSHCQIVERGAARASNPGTGADARRALSRVRPSSQWERRGGREAPEGSPENVEVEHRIPDWISSPGKARPDDMAREARGGAHHLVREGPRRPDGISTSTRSRIPYEVVDLWRMLFVQES